MTDEHRDKISPLAQATESVINQTNLSWDAFLGRHAGCTIETLDLPSVNSGETDPATGDLKPTRRKQLHCTNHNKFSAVHESTGQ